MVEYKFADKDFKPFWYCFVPNQGKPKRKHASLQDALEEAKRISEKGKFVEVLMCQANVCERKQNDKK